MSSKVNITTTEFKNIKTGNKTLGVRIYDDYGQSYDNCWENIPDDDFDVLRKVLTDSCDSNNISAMMDFVAEHETGVCINNQWYDWEEIKHIFDENK